MLLIYYTFIFFHLCVSKSLILAPKINLFYTELCHQTGVKHYIA